MNLADFQRLCDRLNDYCRHAIESAVYSCMERTHFEVTVDHLLIKLLDDPACDIGLIARAHGVDVGAWLTEVTTAVDRCKAGNSAGVHWTEDVIHLVERAWILSSTQLGFPNIRSSALLLAMLVLREESGSFHDTAALGGASSGTTLDEFSVKDLREQIPTLIKGSSEGAVGAPEPGAPVPRATGQALEKFTRSLNEQAREGQLDRAVGRDKEIRQVIDILCRRRKNNAILVGEPGVGKTAIAEGLALRIVEGDVPDVMANMDIRSLDLGLLQAGAGVKGEFENRLTQIMESVASSPTPIVLFIDEAHLLIGAGNQAGGGDAANLLKPALARGKLRCIAATTWTEYKKYFEKDAALQDRFEVVRIEEPSEDLAITMLRGTKDAYEKHHAIQILDSGLEASVRLSSRYLTGRQLPRKAVDLLDTAAARVRVGLTAKPAVVDDLGRRLDNLGVERGAKQRDHDLGLDDHTARLAELDALIEQTEKDFESYRLRWGKEKSAADRYLAARAKVLSVEGKGADDGEAADADEGEGEDERPMDGEMEEALASLRELQGRNPLVPIHLDETIAAQVIADWTGIPVGSMVEDEMPKILDLENRLGERIRGQDHALATLAETIRISKAQLGNPDAPIGVFLLVGPSGTGKTETALSLADILFGGERFMTNINMSEFKEEHTVSLLIGAPPGYVGYGEGGVLTEAVRQRPYTVVLLDEVEKAHPKVMELFYQIFDKGFCEDRTGRYINFRNTIILLTSNLESERMVEMCATEPRPEPKEIVDTIRPALIDHFKPALLARFRVIPYYPLGPSVLQEIVRIKLDRLADRFRRLHHVEMHYGEDLVENLVDRCGVVELGARQLDHVILEEILPPLSTGLLERLAAEQPPKTVGLEINEAGTFEFTFG